METYAVNMVDVSEWDKLVKETYKRPYSFQQQDGCKSRGTFTLAVPEDDEDYENDTVPEAVNGNERGVSFKAWLARDPEKKLPYDGSKSSLELWWERNFYPDVQMIANNLYIKGLLGAGTYTIDIDW
jgi:hypothetical protein